MSHLITFPSSKQTHASIEYFFKGYKMIILYTFQWMALNYICYIQIIGPSLLLQNKIGTNIYFQPSWVKLNDRLCFQNAFNTIKLWYELFHFGISRLSLDASFEKHCLLFLIYPLSRSIDLSTDPGLNSHQISVSYLKLSATCTETFI
jgi:hypothetical protein